LPLSRNYIYKNHKTTNYKVLTGWYYYYTKTLSAGGYGLTISRTYNIYRRDVSYTVSYDVYDKYSGNYIRSVKQNVNSQEEDWKLVY